jgi:hypothetical protein
MAITITPLSSQFVDIMLQDTDVDDTVRVDVTQGTGSVYYIEVNNGIGSSSISFKMYDTTNVTLGTTEPIFIMKVAASATEYCVIPDGMAFSSGLSYCATDQNGNQAAGGGFSGLSGNITLRLITS